MRSPRTTASSPPRTSGLGAALGSRTRRKSRPCLYRRTSSKEGFLGILRAEILGPGLLVDPFDDEGARRHGNRTADCPENGSIQLLVRLILAESGVRAENCAPHDRSPAGRADADPASGLLDDVGDRERQRARVRSLLDLRHLLRHVGLLKRQAAELG